jgi:hypothetical protein
MNNNELNAFFYSLMQKRQFDLNDPICRPFLQDPDLFGRLEAVAASFECEVLMYNGTLYLIPNADNTYLGYSRAQLKNTLLKGTENLGHYYLYMFIILLILVEFYGTEYGRGHSRDFIQIGIFMNKVRDALKNGTEMQENDSQIPFERMLAIYEQMEEGIGTAKRASQYGCIRLVCKFLESQGLINWMENEDQIRTTRKLDDLSDALLRSDEGYQAMMKMAEEIANA